MEASLLIIDDDEASALALSKALRAKGLEASIHFASNPKTAREIFSIKKPEIVVLDLSLNERGVESGFEVLDSITKEDPTTRVVVLTGHGTKEHGIRALQKGAATFLEKPPDVLHLRVILDDCIRQATIRRAYEEMRTQPRPAHGGVLGKSAVATELRAALKRASLSRQPVLLLGETGTGKSFCARAIHGESALATKPFVRYQPTFASADLVNSDLFGHTKGAFTGATDNRVGLLKEAGEGTFFLDEIEALPHETQVALLGVFQDKVFRPVGSPKEEKAGFRLITASNGEIEDDIQKGKLRRDFYHRVAHLVIKIPPLRERTEDIEELSKEHLTHLSQHEGLLATALHEDAILALKAYTWPGNIRELHSTIENGAWRAHFEERRVITPSDLSIIPYSEREPQSLHEKVEAFKRKLIKEALTRNEGSREKAAKELGIDRTTMWRALEKEAR